MLITLSSSHTGAQLSSCWRSKVNGDNGHEKRFCLPAYTPEDAEQLLRLLDERRAALAMRRRWDHRNTSANIQWKTEKRDLPLRCSHRLLMLTSWASNHKKQGLKSPFHRPQPQQIQRLRRQFGKLHDSNLAHLQNPMMKVWETRAKSAQRYDDKVVKTRQILWHQFGKKQLGIWY